MTKDKLSSWFFWSMVAIGVMVFAMVIIGGLTRLTGSGLSMVDWRPITGILPPLNAQQWNEVFQLYQKSPEYLSVNFGMTVDEFKSIFWLEYIHRLWGRSVGVVLLIPTFIAFKHKKFRLKIVALWLLGLSQGALGWYMVKSGLIKDPMVSPYRLTAHFSLALIILAVVIDVLHGLRPGSVRAKGSLQILVAVALVSLTVIMGGFTAGLHAGLIYNTFPLMGDQYMPSEVFHLQPIWKNLFENPAAVQFIHRNLAILTVGYICFISWRNWDNKMYRALMAMALIQLALGISAVLFVVPIWLASVHQAWAVLLFAKCLWIYHGTQSGATSGR